jgi:molecular chaperone DnaK
LKKALEAGEIEGIKSSKEKLEGVLQPLVMKVYEQAAAAAQGGADTTSDKKDDGVVDADFEEVKDDNK